MKHSIKIAVTLTADTEADLQEFVAAVESALESIRAGETSLGFVVGDDQAEITVEAFEIDEDQ